MLTAPIGAWTVWKTVVTAAEAAEIEHLGPHDLRRSCAKFCRKAGGDIEQVQELLGHEDISTTVLYLHIQPGVASVLSTDLLGVRSVCRSDGKSHLRSTFAYGTLSEIRLSGSNLRVSDSTIWCDLKPRPAERRNRVLTQSRESLSERGREGRRHSCHRPTEFPNKPFELSTHLADETLSKGKIALRFGRNVIDRANQWRCRSRFLPNVGRKIA